MLDEAMRRRYSASPNEGFFTAAACTNLENFEPEDNLTR